MSLGGGRASAGMSAPGPPCPVVRSDPFLTCSVWRLTLVSPAFVPGLGLPPGVCEATVPLPGAGRAEGPGRTDTSGRTKWKGTQWAGLHLAFWYWGRGVTGGGPGWSRLPAMFTELVTGLQGPREDGRLHGGRLGLCVSQRASMAGVVSGAGLTVSGALV